MNDTFYKRFDVDINRLLRDYLTNPIKKLKDGNPLGYTYEKPNEADLRYLFLEKNISGAQLAKYFGVGRHIFEKWTAYFNIKKRKELIYESQSLSLSAETKEESIAKRNNVKNAMLEKYGVDNPMKNPEIVKKARNSCLQKYGRNNVSQAHIKDEYYELLMDGEKLKSYIINNNVINATDLGNELKIGETAALRYLKKYNLIHLCDYCVSTPEKELRDFVSENVGVEFNRKDLLGCRKEIDIYIPSKNIGIEFNGNFWHSDIKRPKLYHQEKSMLANENGIFLYHIFEYEWYNKKPQIMNQLKNLLGINQYKIGARKCVIKEVSNKEKSQFLNENHMQGNDSSSVKFGLYYEDKLVSIMTFCKPRFNKKYEWELSRFCSLANHNVMGGANRLFNHFVKVYHPKNVISYSNIAHTRGMIYETIGFKQLGISEPNYVWVNHKDVLARYQCQKHRLVALGYDGVSETEIMHNLGYFRIYDCGNKVWVWKKDA